jgi:hypothetical protein
MQTLKGLQKQRMLTDWSLGRLSPLSDQSMQGRASGDIKASRSVGFLGVATLPVTQEWTAVAHGDGVWVAVGGIYLSGWTNYAARSINGGRNWRRVTLPVSGTWTGVAYGNRVWVAVGGQSNGGIIRSTNQGRSWTQTAANGVYFSHVVFENGVFMALSRFNASVFISSDGFLTWTEVALPAAINPIWASLAYGAGTWLVSGYDGGTVNFYVARSTNNGASWSSVLSVPATNPPPYGVGQIAYGNGVFAFASDFYGLEARFSTNAGVSFAPATPPAAIGTAMAGAPDRLVAAGGTGFGGGLVTASSNRLTSTNGSTWTVSSGPIAIITPPNGLAYGNGKFAQIGFNSDKIVFFT